MGTCLDRGKALENRVRFSLSRYDYSTTDYVIPHLIGNIVENIKLRRDKDNIILICKGILLYIYPPFRLQHSNASESQLGHQTGTRVGVIRQGSQSSYMIRDGKER